MSRRRRLASEFTAAWKAFLRRRTAVFFPFFFPVIIVVIFGALVGTRPTGGGLFAQPPGYYVPGYLAVVVLFTPLSRVGSEVARHREGRRFEKLATTPLRRWEWLLAQTLVNVVVIGLTALLLLGLTAAITPATIPLDPAALLLVPFVVAGVALFCGVGAVLGGLADSQDGVIAASNALAFPLLFLSEAFLTPDMLPAWLRPAMAASPVSLFARGVRALTFDPAAAGPLGVPGALAALAAVAAVGLVAGAVSIPRTD